MSYSSVSVVIPTYNRAPMLREALESVRCQSVQPLEVIVIDDGSTDETPQVIRHVQPWVRYLRQANQGVAAARNLGIQQAHGAWVAFLDSDDLWLPRKLERQLAFLRAHPETGLLYARMWSYQVDTPAQRQLEPRTVARSFDELLNGPNSVTTSTVVVRRDCFGVAGLFNQELPAVEDHELWLRIARRFPIAFLDEPLAEYRRHAQGFGATPVRLYEGYRGFYEIILRDYRAQLRDPRGAQRQLAKFEYLCGTAALRRGEGRQATRLISRALARDSGLGFQFIGERDPWRRRTWLPLKPYAALTVSLLSCLRGRGGFGLAGYAGR